MSRGWHRHGLPHHQAWRSLSQRSRMAYAAALALAALGLWWGVRSLRVEDPTWLGVRQSGILRVCTDPSWPPFEAFNPATGQIDGLDADLARRLAGRLAPGVHAEFVTVGFDGLYDALRASRCDVVVSALPYDPTRVGYVRYSVAYFNAGLVLVTRQGATGMSGVEDLAGRAVGVEWGFVPEGDTRQRVALQRLGVRRYPTAEDALRALHTGEIDAALVDRITFLAYSRDCPGLEIVGAPLTDVHYVIPVRPDSVLLLRELDRVLLEMQQDGTLEEIEERWF